MVQIEGTTYLTVREAAAVIGVSVEYVRRASTVLFAIEFPQGKRTTRLFPGARVEWFAGARARFYAQKTNAARAFAAEVTPIAGDEGGE